jgi:radical SAM-linked protein
MSGITPIKHRLNITFGKFGALKYTGSVDISKVWERVLRRADLPILYTQGFNTRPRIQLAATLPIGISSECEIIDVSLREQLSTLDGLLDTIAAVSPQGLTLHGVESVDVNGPALQTLVRSAQYRIHAEDEIEPDRLGEIVQQTLDAERILKVTERKRKGKKARKSSVDMRPMIHDLHIDDRGDLIAHLATGERGNLQPFDLLEQMGLKDVYFSIHRFALHFDDYYQRLLARHAEVS